jgi:molybdopterin-guanine dinucleotide biosynthesis protein A
LGGLILAGGRGSRLPHKCFRLLHGKPLIFHVFERVSILTQDIVVVAKTTQQQGRLKTILPSVRIVLDELEDESPLVGFLSGLEALRTTYVLAVPCDTPLVEPKLIRTLYKQAVNHDCAIPMSEGKMNPLLAVYNRLSAIHASKTSLKDSERSMHEMVAGLRRVVKVPIATLRRADPDLVSFLNINTELELARARRILRRKSNERKRRLL